jgi:hypothetical protein
MNTRARWLADQMSRIHPGHVALAACSVFACVLVLLAVAVLIPEDGNGRPTTTSPSVQTLAHR